MTWPASPPPADPWGTPPPQQQPSAPPPVPPSASELLGGAGIKGFSFDGTPPLRLGGKIVSVEVKQKLDFDTKQPMTWNDGRPRWVLVVGCATDLREDPEDDGVRAHYLEYKKAEAVKSQLQAAGVQAPEVDGYMYLTYLAPAPPKGKAKSYSAEYTRPGQAPPPPMSAPAATPPSGTHPGVAAMSHGAPQALAQALVGLGMTLDEANRLPTLAAGWQGAQASEILPYIRQAPAQQPSYSSEPPF